MPDPAHKLILGIQEREGTTYYSDHELTDVRVIGFISAAIILKDTGEPETRWRHVGTTGTAVQALAMFMTATPGMKEALDGMYVLVKNMSQVGVQKP